MSMSTNLKLNKIGKYLYDNIDGAYKYKQGANQCDIYMIVYYQLPWLDRIPGKADTGYNDLHEMRLDINLATYQNKIRISVTEISPEERTIVYFVMNEEKLQDLEVAKDTILKKLYFRLEQNYIDYDFIF